MKVPRDQRSRGSSSACAAWGCRHSASQRTAGDLYVVVDVVLPRALDDDTRRLYEELAKVDAKG